MSPGNTETTIQMVVVSVCLFGRKDGMGAGASHGPKDESSTMSGEVQHVGVRSSLSCPLLLV
jgi:hypothetical protein